MPGYMIFNQDRAYSESELKFLSKEESKAL